MSNRTKAIDSVQRTLSRLMRISGSRATFARQSAAVGVTLTQPAYVLLRVLVDSGPVAMGELAKLAHMDAGMTARQVNGLVEDGLVARQQDPSDGRVTLVVATASGQSTAQALREVRTRHLERALTDWSATDLNALDELLLRFHADTARTPLED